MKGNLRWFSGKFNSKSAVNRHSIGEEQLDDRKRTFYAGMISQVRDDAGFSSGTGRGGGAPLTHDTGTKSPLAARAIHESTGLFNNRNRSGWSTPRCIGNRIYLALIFSLPSLFCHACLRTDSKKDRD